MLAQLAARLRERQGGAGGPGAGIVLGEEGETVVVDDNCSVRLSLIPIKQLDAEDMKGDVTTEEIRDPELCRGVILHMQRCLECVDFPSYLGNMTSIYPALKEAGHGPT